MKISQCFNSFGLSHVLKHLSHAGATIQQLDTPENLEKCLKLKKIYLDVFRPSRPIGNLDKNKYHVLYKYKSIYFINQNKFITQF